MATETVTYGRLLRGLTPPRIEPDTLAAGSGTLLRGTLLGRVLLSIAAAVAGTNTGNGTCTSQVLRAGAKAGVYTITCITKATAATFKVIDPQGYRCADAIAGTPYTGPIGFSIAQGNTVFEVADSFTITITGGFGSLKKVDPAAVDGSAVAECVLDADATLANAATTACSTITEGDLNEDAIILTEGDTIAAHRQELRARGIMLGTPVYL